MKKSPYLFDGRLADVLALIQFLSAYPDYDLEADKLRGKIARSPVSAEEWPDVLREHPEFFRESEHAGDFCLVLRRTKPKDAKRERPPLESDELALLMNTATFLQRHALETRMARRAWIPVAVTVFAAIIAAVSAIFAAIIRTGG